MKYRPQGHLVAAALTLVVMGVGFYGSAVVLATLGHDPQQEYAATVASFPKHVVLSDSSIFAKAAVIYDVTTGSIVYQKNPTEPLPLASITKLITAHTALSLESPETMVTITQQELISRDGGLKAGDTVSVNDLLRLGLIMSSNSAMAAVADSLGSSSIDIINQHAAQLNLSHTVVYNPAGLDVSTTTAGAYGSAYDVALLAASFYKAHPDYFELTRSEFVSFDVAGHHVGGPATAAPLLPIPGLIGAKTGFTDLAGGNLVVVFDLDIGHPLVAVVLGSTEEGRFEDIETLITAARNSL